MLDKLEVVARPEGWYENAMPNDLDCLTGADAATSDEGAPPQKANPKGRLPASKPPPGIVYFIGGAKGPIKVGFTHDLAARLKRLQSNSPQKLSVLAAFYGEKFDEWEIHSLFREWRLHGEWFKRSPEVLQHIAFWQKRMPPDLPKAYGADCELSAPSVLEAGR